MNFSEIAVARQSCRNYNPDKQIESEKLNAILNCARLAPSACNGQPYHITVCIGDSAKEMAKLVGGLGMNKFAKDVPVFLIISEMPYVKSAAMGAKIKHNDYRSIDIGILSAYITAEAAAQGIGSCILGWFDGEKIAERCRLDGAVRLVITLGYADESDVLRKKKRKDLNELISIIQ